MFRENAKVLRENFRKAEKERDDMKQRAETAEADLSALLEGDEAVRVAEEAKRAAEEAQEAAKTKRQTLVDKRLKK